MLTLDARFAVLNQAVWDALPVIKNEAFVTGERLEDLGEVHGQYIPETGTILLNPRLLAGSVQMLPMLDIDGNDPPLRMPAISRAYHTLAHEYFHAILYTAGLD